MTLPSRKTGRRSRPPLINPRLLKWLVSCVTRVVHCNDAPRLTWEEWEGQIRKAFVEAGCEEDLEEFVSFFQLEEYRNINHSGD